MPNLQPVRFAATRQFAKAFARLPAKKQEKVRQVLATALDDISAPLLRLHPLTGDWAGAYSLSAGGDLRILFEVVEEPGDNQSQDDDQTEGRDDKESQTVVVGILITVGTHAQLYG
ncbi:MAG: hypothetical protein FWD18_09430 [Micrococcales bacterium]|nr:hypothetical protein [Micrococcales bacterium]